MHNPTNFSLSYILIKRCKGMPQNLIIIHTLKRKSKIGINTQFNELNYMTGSSRQKIVIPSGSLYHFYIMDL